MSDKRFRFIRSLFIFLLVVVTFKLFNIQAINGRDYSTAAALQQTRNRVVYRERGDIIDKNGIRFTGRETYWKAILLPATLLNNSTELRVVADILNLSVNQLQSQLSKSNLPFLSDVTTAQAKAISDSSLKGLSVINMRMRNNADTLATHIIGYIDEKGEEGLAGIEKFYQDSLKRGGGVYAGVLADAGNSYMSSFGYRIWDDMGEEKLNVKLTLNHHIQSIVEEAMDRMVDKGAVVVLDIITGEIVAIASRPNFNPAHINPSLNDEDQALFNRALGVYTPGSIFKIVTAAAALENGLTADLTYECPGYVDLGGIRIKCSSFEKGGHGSVNMAQAFAQSCNSYFINLGLEVGQDDILNMAVRFGLGLKTGLYMEHIDEPSGMLPNSIGYTSPVEVANISIGQGEILISPIQAANMTAVIANGGILNRVSLVDSIVNDKGERIRNVGPQSWERAISKDTASILQGMMLLTVQSGTAGLAAIRGYGGSAGKTGSAETGWIKDDRNILHAWFTGYFPADTPRYSVCIFIEDGKSGSSSAAPVFAEISAKIVDAGYSSK